MLWPPTLEMYDVCASGSTFFEPLNIMCSKRCANPVRPGALVFRAHVVPDLHVDDRRRVILEQHDREAVRQRRDAVVELRRRYCGGKRRGREEDGNCRPSGQYARQPDDDVSGASGSDRAFCDYGTILFSSASSRPTEIGQSPLQFGKGPEDRHRLQPFRLSMAG